MEDYHPLTNVTLGFNDKIWFIHLNQALANGTYYRPTDKGGGGYKLINILVISSYEHPQYVKTDTYTILC